MNRTLLSVLVAGYLSVGSLACQPQGDGAVQGDQAASDDSSVVPPTPVDLAPWAERIANIHATTVFADVQAHPSRFHRGNLLEDLYGCRRYRRRRQNSLTTVVSHP